MSSFLLCRKKVVPSFYNDCLPSFKGPPKFCTAHKIIVVNGILVCGYSFKARYGFPCRHLFCIEPNYNTQDIHCRWQKTYSVYSYSHDKRDIT